MTSNGGTLHGVPQSGHSCSQCGLIVDSISSLQVHMQYHHENVRWGQSPPTSGIPSSTTPTTPTDTETNNNNVQPLGKHHNHIKAGLSPQHHQNTIAAADSSDNHNNPPTPQPNNNSNHSNNTDSGTPQNYSGGNSPYGAQQHTPSATQIISPPASEMHYPTYYDQYYHHGVDYSTAQVPPSTSPHLLNNGSQSQQQQEYKTVPSTRYHPYINSNSNSHSTIAPINGQSVQITNNGLSPRVVSSTSPTQNSLLQTTTTSTASSPTGGLMNIPPGQPTPSPSPKQCDKCGVVCETDGQLIEHSATAHPGVTSQEGNVKSENSDSQSYSTFPEPQYIKDEPSSNILDLDSQKMVYPQHHEGALPPMHSLHHLQSMQRHTMMWGGHDPHHGFIPPHPNNEIKSPYFHHQSMKPEYPPTPPIIKNEYLQPTHMKNDYGGPILPPAPVSMKQEYHIKSEYNMQPNQAATGMTQSGPLPPPNSINSKTFQTDINEAGNQLTTSPSDFPSTTTPQENGTQFRSFEPPSSSLPASKGTSWKSNEARRPKTYNCTACNKWFTSSGHLKRHYNTTLHKNAVKSSGQPDPATLPISAHHHPNRDPNYLGKRRSHHRNHQNAQQQQSQAQQNNSQQNAQQTGQQNSSQLQAVPPGEDPRSPEYQPQFTLPSFGSTALPQGFQQYSTNLHNSTPVPPNGEAGPSVQASQPRDLQTQMINNNNLLMLHQPEVHQRVDQGQEHISTTIHMPINSIMPQHMQLPHINSINNSMDQQFPLDINTNIHTSYIITEAQNYHHTIGSHIDQNQLHHLKSHEMDDSMNQIIIVPQTQSIDSMQPLPSLHPNPHGAITSLNSYDNILSRFTGGAAYQGDMAPPFSPDIPEQYHTSTTTHTMTAYQDEDEASSLPQSAAEMVILPNSHSELDMAPSSPSVSSTLPGNINMDMSKNSITEAGKHKCLECDKVFNKSCYLTQHNKTCHSGDKPFKCQRCGKRFNCGASHEEHFAKHGNNKPFKCEVCPKAFNHKTDLRRHMCLHSGSKPYACSECGKGFIRKDHMLKHTETHRRRSSMLAAQKKAQSNKINGKKRESSISNTNDSSDSIQF